MVRRIFDHCQKSARISLKKKVTIAETVSYAVEKGSFSVLGKMTLLMLSKKFTFFRVATASKNAIKKVTSNKCSIGVVINEDDSHNVDSPSAHAFDIPKTNLTKIRSA